MDTPQSITPLDRARSLVATVDAGAEEGEARRRLADATVSAIRASGLFRLCVPRRYGGLEAPACEMIAAVEEVARGDGSAAWCIAIAATSGLLGGYLPEDEAREIYASDPLAASGGVFAPLGEAVVEGDGYRIRGRWPFASGIHHCSWLMGGCVVIEAGKPGLSASGAPDSRLMLFPAAEATIVDTWSVAGLCATGSHDMQVADLWVPRSRTVSLVDDKPRERGPLYLFPVFGCLAIGIAAVALGIARRGIDELCDLAAAKTPTGSRRRLADRGHVQMQVARAEAAYGAARAYLHDTVTCTWEMASRCGEISLRQRALLRLAASYCVTQAAGVVDAMYEAGGGTSIYRSSALQRCLRDVHTATQHMMVASPTLELAGRVLLGREADTSVL
ncbi:MAG: acyl-CoA dehydrogenase family protein [Deltaproteobacteria bacterium]|nr:acyl-CoA dehydrogenase family protein [Deltaproteobacteria bacterium]